MMSSGPFNIGGIYTRKEMTLHVSTSGNDSNSGTIASSPLRTFAAAINRLPKIIAHDVNIMVYGQHTESVIIRGRSVLATLSIMGAVGNRTTNGIGDLLMRNVGGVTRVTGLTINSTDDGNAMVYEYCGGHHYIDNVISEKPLPPEPIDYSQHTGNIDQGRGVMALWGSHVSVYNSRFSGRRYGVRASYGGAVLECRNCDGTNNAIGAGARFGGMVTIYDGCPAGAITRTSTLSGGIIIEDNVVLMGDTGPG